jgi:DNA-binding protein H-NS
MPPRTASKILAEWHELAMQQEEATDAELADAIAARIEQVRREYIEGVPADSTPPSESSGEQTASRRLPDHQR